MNSLLQSLLQLAAKSGQFTADQATAVWRRLWHIVAGLLFACFIVFLANTMFGWHWPALVLAIVFVLAASFAWTKPLFFLSVGIAGVAEKLATDATLAKGLQDAFKAYVGLFKWSVVAVVFYCFAMFLFSFNENSSMAVTALFALAVAGLCLWAWSDLFHGEWARKTVYWGSVALVICGLLSQIPAPYWIKYVGWAPSFAPAKTEQTVYKIRKAQADNKERSEDEVLKQLLKKVRDGNALTPAEETLVTKKEAAAKTVKAFAGSDPESPSLTTVYGSVKKYWLWVLGFCLLVYGIGKLIGGKWASASAFVAVSVAGLCFVVAPVGAWIDTPSVSSVSKRSTIPLASSPQSEWPKLVIKPKEKGFVRYSSEMVGKHIVLDGKFVLHNVYSDGRECTSDEFCAGGPQQSAYVINESESETLIIGYAFAPN